MATVHDLLLERARQIQGQQRTGAAVPFFEKNKGYWSNLNKPQGPVAPPPQPKPQARFDAETAMQLPQEWDYQAANTGNKLGPYGEQLPYGAESWNPYGKPYYGEGLQGWMKGLVSRMTAPVGEGGTLGQVVANYLPNYAKTFGVEPISPEQYISNVGSEEGGAISPTTFVTRGANELVKTGLGVLGEPAKKFEQYLSMAKSAQAASPFRNPDYKQMTLRESADRLTDAYQSGRVLYTSAVDPLVTKEFMRRYEAGENPEFLAMELENPLAEMAGQLVLDPLNMLGGLTRGARDAKRVNKVVNEFFQIVPDVEEALRSANITSDARAVTALQNVGEATIRGFKRMSEDYGIRSLTAAGKRHVVGMRTGELAGWIVANAQDDEQAAEALLALARMASGDIDEIAQGFAYAKNFIEPRPLMSRAGNELGAVLRRALTDPDTGEFSARSAQKFLDDMAAQPDAPAMIDFIGKKAYGAINDLLPDINTKLEKGAIVPWQYKAISNMNDIAQKAVYKPINSFLSGIYMGLSPGYVARNLSSNTVGILTDYGPAAFKNWKPASLLGKTRDLLGGVLPKGVEGFGGGTTGVDIYRQAKRLPGIKAGEAMEELSAAQVVYKSVTDTMRKALRPGRALPDIRDLVNAGLPEPSAQQLVRMVIDAKGDVKKAVAAFRAAAGTGSVEAWRTLAWLNPADSRALEGFNLLDEVRDAIQAPTREEAFQKINDLFDETIADAGKVADEFPAIADDAQELHVVQSLTGNVANDTMREATSVFQANSQARLLYEQSLREAYKGVQMPDEIADFMINAPAAKQEESIRWSNKYYKIFEDIKHSTKGNWAARWKDIGIPGEPPDGLTKEGLLKAFWNDFWYPTQRQRWTDFTEQYAAFAEQAIAGGTPTPLVERAREALNVMRQWDDVVFGGVPAAPRTGAQAAPKGWKLHLATDNPEEVSRYLATKGYTHKVGRSGQAGKDITIYTTGRVEAQQIADDISANLDNLLKEPLGDTLTDDMMFGNKVMGRFDPRDPEFHQYGKGGVPWLKEDVLQVQYGAMTPEQATQRALERLREKYPEFEGAIREIVTPPPPYAGNTPTLARAVTEQLPGLNDLRARVLGQLSDVWGEVEPVVMNGTVDHAIARWAKTAERNVAEARLIAANVADEARKFTLLSYPEKTYADLALAYIYPYHFWYTRTYTNWLKRIVQTPEVLAGYAKYREALAKIHAGAPEWWKYNINSNELLGRDDENPLFFNLEATLSPLNGMTGVDFNDPRKRVNWWTATLDDLGKFGPSTWTPYSMATALALYLTGEEEAAARWGSRLIPQTATLKAATHLLNIGPPGGLELDPAVMFFSGGVDPHERNRIGRMLTVLVENGEITREQADEAAYRQTGEIWEMAKDAAATARAPGQISSFLFGAGFRARNLTDIQIDRFYSEYYNLWDLKDNMTEDEFQEAMDGMRDEYPFMDNLLLSRKASPFRDRSYAYSVLGRIPPGQKDELLEAVGLDSRLYDKFWDTKGYVNEWSETDRTRFMAAVVDMGALLALPDDATKTEWSAVTDRYAQLDGLMEQNFGEDILEQIDHYFALKATDRDAANDYADQTGVAQALSWKDATIMNDPLLNKYYGSIEKIEYYYDGIMYDAIAGKLGKDIWDKWDEYNLAKLESAAAGKAYWKAHPELKEYTTLKAAYEKITAEMVASAAKALPETPMPFLRPGVTPQSFGEQDISGYVENPQPTVYDYTWNDWAGMMSPQLANLVLDYAFTGEELTETAKDQIDYIAQQEGITQELMLELMAQSVQQ